MPTKGQISYRLHQIRSLKSTIATEGTSYPQYVDGWKRQLMRHEAALRKLGFEATSKSEQSVQDRLVRSSKRGRGLLLSASDVIELCKLLGVFESVS